MIGVAISTTGEAHRLRFLETNVGRWLKALPKGSPVIVTVDGSRVETQRVVDRLWAAYGGEETNNLTVLTVGTRKSTLRDPHHRRMGVAASKNVGIEALMDAGVDRLFLSDDDVGPVDRTAVDLHLISGLHHSMVCWGRSRLKATNVGYAEWTWPRGVVLHADRSVIDVAGGMVEAFGPGGHEHAEWSMRINNLGLTPAPFCTPPRYALRSSASAMAAETLWDAEDMRRPGETLEAHARRKRANTTIDPDSRDWEWIKTVMDKMKGSTEYVPFRAHENGRLSATMAWTLTSQGAGGEK